MGEGVKKNIPLLEGERRDNFLSLSSQAMERGKEGLPASPKKKGIAPSFSSPPCRIQERKEEGLHFVLPLLRRGKEENRPGASLQCVRKIKGKPFFLFFSFLLGSGRRGERKEEGERKRRVAAALFSLGGGGTRAGRRRGRKKK